MTHALAVCLAMHLSNCVPLFPIEPSCHVQQVLLYVAWHESMITKRYWMLHCFMSNYELPYMSHYILP